MTIIVRPCNKVGSRSLVNWLTLIFHFVSIYVHLYNKESFTTIKVDFNKVNLSLR